MLSGGGGLDESIPYNGGGPYEGLESIVTRRGFVGWLLVPIVVASVLLVAAAWGQDAAETSKYDFAKIMSQQGILVGMAIAFVAGILTSFTPCVYPMIPITIGIIGGRRDEEGSSVWRSFGLTCVYVLGLAITYSVLGLLAGMFGASVRSFLMGPWVLIGVAVIFTVLGLGMLGLFELQVPPAIANKLQSVGGTGLLGILLMGMVSGIVASPCTAAPLAGILLYVATEGSAFTGFILLFTYAWGMGLLLIAVGTSAGALKSMPKSGTWMIDVQKLFGFLMIGVAFYFIRTLVPDIVYYIGLSACMIAGGVAFGALDSLPENPGGGARFKKGVALVTMVLGLYVLIGSLATHRVLLPEQPAVAATGVAGPVGPGGPVTPTRIEIDWETDIEAAFARAEAEGKRVFIDFGADWCEACHEMDKDAFPRQDIVAAAAGFVALKVDMTEVSEEEGVLEEKYQVLGLPHLVIADADREEIAAATSYDDGPDGVLAFLQANAFGEGTDGPAGTGST